MSNTVSEKDKTDPKSSTTTWSEWGETSLRQATGAGSILLTLGALGTVATFCTSYLLPSPGDDDTYTLGRCNETLHHAAQLTSTAGRALLEVSRDARMYSEGWKGLTQGLVL